MKKTIWAICIVLLVLVLTGTFVMSDSPALAADQERTQEQIQTQEQIYGSQLMTPQEREEYRARMRTAKTSEERERIRNEHHERMKERAREQGVTLADEPPERGMGRGMGPGGGMGTGSSGKGQGGRNR
jgi:hypothetical protein